MLRLLLKVQSLATGKACQVQRAVIAILEEPGSRDPMFVFRTTALRSPAWSRADPETHTSPPDCRPQPRKPQFLTSTRCHDVIDHASPSEKLLCEEELIWSRNMLVRVSASELDVEESGRTAGSFVSKLKRLWPQRRDAPCTGRRPGPAQSRSRKWPQSRQLSLRWELDKPSRAQTERSGRLPKGQWLDVQSGGHTAHAALAGSLDPCPKPKSEICCLTPH